MIFNPFVETERLGSLKFFISILLPTPQDLKAWRTPCVQFVLTLSVLVIWR